MLTSEDLAAIPAALTRFLQPFAAGFGGYHRAAKAQQYITAVLTQRTERRNAENLTEVMDGILPRALQAFLSTMAWGLADLLITLHTELAALLAAADGVWVIDDSGIPKQGTHSVGVARQWCGRLGKVANCQVGVWLAYASSRGAALVDGRLYLPAAWLTPARRTAGQIPAQLPFRTKIDLALGMLRVALHRGQLPAAWVVADETYGRNATFRQGVAALGLWYLGEIDKSTRIRRGKQLVTIEAVATALPASAWTVVEVGDGAQGPRRWRLYACRVRGEGREYHRPQWLVLRTNLDGSEPRYYFSNAPWGTDRVTFGRVINQRSRVEQLIEEQKGECGWDEYEVRSWPGWYHHLVLTLLARAFLLAQQQAWAEKGGRG